MQYFIPAVAAFLKPFVHKVCRLVPVGNSCFPLSTRNLLYAACPEQIMAPLPPLEPRRLVVGLLFALLGGGDMKAAIYMMFFLTLFVVTFLFAFAVGTP